MLCRPNWRDPTDYVFIERYRPELVAWEFLRRNPDYQQDYNWFITRWNELETEYGAPPNRNFNAWKNDPRAYRSEHEIYHLNDNIPGAGTVDCASQEDKLLIECWMGTKWGFYKFPIDPTKDSPIINTDLTWRTTPVSVRFYNEDSITEISSRNLENKIAIIFDLKKDLKEQIQSAKQQLIIAQKNNLKSNQTMQEWILSLRVLDAIHDGISESDIQETIKLTQEDFLLIKTQAVNLLCDQYREIVNSV